jgi:lysozyme family protein
MASFKVFEPLLLKQEGGYSNKKNDSGGETWMGISHNNYPGWIGWSIIHANLSHRPSDDYNGWKAFSIFLRTLPQLQILVDSFYETTFWDHMKGDSINNQSIANYIADWGVNAGLSVPIKHTQKVLGFGIEDQDGVMGSQTLTSINSANGATLFQNLVSERISFYKAVIVAHPEDKEFENDWMERANSFKYSA